MKFILASSFKEMPQLYLSDSFIEFTMPSGVEVVHGIEARYLESLVFHDGVKEIGGCGGYLLKDLVLPDSVEILSGFGNCPFLKQIELPKNLKRLEGGSFEVTCASILNSTRYSSDPRMQELYKLFDCDNDELPGRVTAWSEVRIPEGVEYVGCSVFSRYNDVTFYISKNANTKEWSSEWNKIANGSMKFQEAKVIKY